MGTEIALDVDGIRLDWSKNGRGADHGPLFQTNDLKRMRSDQINYDCVDNEDPELAEMEMGFAKSLGDVVPRIELLGFGLESIEHEYSCVAEECREDRQFLNFPGFVQPSELMTFAEFCEFVVMHHISALDDTFIGSVGDNGHRCVMNRFFDEASKRRIPYSPYRCTSYSERSCFGRLINILHPYSVLRLLAENKENRKAEVVWQYGPLVNAGWANKDEFVPNAKRNQTFLIATEGNTDGLILKHAFSLLRPEIADFFRFIDMSEDYPFSGAGNLFRFASGLAKIDVHNQVVFVLDNDAEGLEACARIQDISLPSNMSAILLPELEALRLFPTRGPDGENTADINKRAAAIECYLDLEAADLPPAEVIWTNYKKELKTYQGALQKKAIYMKAFLKQTSASLTTGTYNVNKISVVLDRIYHASCSIASDVGRPLHA